MKYFVRNLNTKPESLRKCRKFTTGFTLLELLIVIGILAVLASVTFIAINPAEQLKKTRDASRLSDLETLSKALSIYVTDTGGSVSIGTTTLTYLSLSDPAATTSAGSDCSGLGFPAGYFRCAGPNYLQKTDGTGWIPVNFSQISIGNPLQKLPVDPTNTYSSNLYYSYFPGSGVFKLAAKPESSNYLAKAGQSASMFQAGNDYTLAGGQNWVLVPGNSAFGTGSFWVMKYEAKCAQSNVGLTSPDTGYHTYSDSGTACVSANSRNIASVPDGYPIANISHTTAKTYCSSIGAHLLTNDEWMTIARNAEQVNSNWTASAVGSGALFSGHNDNASDDGAVALPAGDDNNGYYKTANVSPSNQKRTWTLSNGSVVWDFPGNVWEHVQRSVNNTGDLTTAIDLPPCSDSVAGWGWCQFASGGSPYVSSWTADVAQDKVGPSNASWYSDKGMGQVYTYKNGTDQATTVFLRGAAWSHGSNAGAFALNLTWGAGNAGYNVGFRCAR